MSHVKGESSVIILDSLTFVSLLIIQFIDLRTQGAGNEVKQREVDQAEENGDAG